MIGIAQLDAKDCTGTSSIYSWTWASNSPGGIGGLLWMIGPLVKALPGLLFIHNMCPQKGCWPCNSCNGPKNVQLLP